MSIFDFIPEEWRQFIPFLKNKGKQQQLKAELDALKEELKQQQKPEGQLPEEPQPDSTSDNSRVSQSIEKINALLTETDTPWYKKLLKLGLFVGPLVLSYFLAIYIHSHQGLILEHQELIYPIDAYELNSDNETFELTDEFKGRFWEEFPGFYFTEKEKRDYYDPNLLFFADTNGYIEVKLILLNSSSSFPLMVSTLGVTVKKEEDTPFPWEKINIKPELVRTHLNGDRTEISNPGPAPIYNIKLNYSINKKVIKEEEHWLLSKGESWSFNNVPELNGYNNISDFVDREKNLLEKGYVYARAPMDTKGLTKSDYEEINGVKFFVVQTISDLKRITDVIELKDIEMNFGYTTVAGEKLEMTWNNKLDSTLYLAEYTEVLLSLEEAKVYDTLKSYVKVADLGISTMEPFSGLLAAESIYSLLGNKPEYNPEGVALITQNVTLDVASLKQGMYVSNTLNIDQILNADGYVVLYIKLINSTNGKYSVRLKANSEEVSEVYLETLIPEETEFVFPNSLYFFDKEFDKRE